MSIDSFLEHTPKIDPSVYIAPGAQIIGRVTLEKNVSIWHNTVIRGDINDIFVGEGSNIQDLSLLHVADHLPCIVGKNVLGGHRIILHGCTVGDEVMIGMGAILLNGCKIGDGAFIAAGTVVKENFVVPPRTLVAGVPGKIIREVTQQDIEQNMIYVKKYQRLAEVYKKVSH
jgi:carbonic anhydrase/acetyltransferase-like protein (isoleucine patch superfamily)